MAKLVTGFDLDSGIVSIDVPHGDLVVEVATALGRWSEEARRLAADMAVLAADGVFLDGDRPLAPGWRETKRGGRHKSWFLVWPLEYSSRMGMARSQYVKVGDYEETRQKVERTLVYAEIKARRDGLVIRIERMGWGLKRLVADLATR